MYDTETRLARTERRLRLLELALDGLAEGLCETAAEEADMAERYRGLWMLEAAIRSRAKAAGVNEAINCVFDVIKYHREGRLDFYLDLPEDHELSKGAQND